MLEPWNNALLDPPPVNTYLCKESIDTTNLRTILEDVSQVLCNQSPLHQEAAIVSRLVYKFDKKFRNDIGYRNLKKVNTALRRYLKLDLARVIENFNSVVPSADSDEEYLPTRQMLEYVLVRIQSFSKVTVRLCICAKISAIFYWDRVTRGESHWMSLMPYAVLCRVWSLCSVLLKQSCMWYTRLYSYLYILQPKGLQFLPNGYSLPVDIEQWLDIHNLDEHGKFHWSRNRCIEVISSLEDEENEDVMDIFQYIQHVRKEVDDPEINYLDESLNVKPEVSQTATDYTNMVHSSKKIVCSEIGESISRESFKKLSYNEFVEEDHLIEKHIENICIKSHKKKAIIHHHLHNAETVTTENEIKVFIAKEDRLRNNGNKQSLSSHLGFMQWQSLKKSVNNLYNKGFTDEITCKKFKKIWKNRCKDYS